MIQLSALVNNQSYFCFNDVGIIESKLSTAFRDRKRPSCFSLNCTRIVDLGAQYRISHRQLE